MSVTAPARLGGPTRAGRAGLTDCGFTGALISHDKLLLQTNPERELGNTSYKLGQVSRQPPRPPTSPHVPARLCLASDWGHLVQQKEKLHPLCLVVVIFITERLRCCMCGDAGACKATETV